MINHTPNQSKYYLKLNQEKLTLPSSSLTWMRFPSAEITLAPIATSNSLPDIGSIQI